MKLDPLEFWPKYALLLPIHARLAAKILAAPATSGDVERFFSLAGRILCKTRAKLTADHVNEMSCLNKWINANMNGNNSIVETKRSKATSRFTTLSLMLELEGGEDSDESDEEEDEE